MLRHLETEPSTENATLQELKVAMETSRTRGGLYPLGCDSFSGAGSGAIKSMRAVLTQ